MRILIILRGPPGSGKSHFVSQNKLEPYTLSSDALRLLYSSPSLTYQGEFQINQSQDKEVWDHFYKLVEHRMINGDFTVVDATHCKREYINKYRDVATKYKYRCFVVDFTDVPLEVCKKNNKSREPYKVVPEPVVAKFYYAGKSKSELPGTWCKVIKPAELPVIVLDDCMLTLGQKTIAWRIATADQWKKIHYIGDIQGCYAPLEEYFKKNPMREDELYVFIGDLLDRGIQNYEVLQFMLSIFEKKNVIIIEGNHDTYLWKWSMGDDVKNKEFLKRTVPQITKDCKDDTQLEEFKKKIRIFCRTWHQCYYHSFQGKEILVTHGGLPCVPQSLHLVSTNEIIEGTGDFDDNIDDIFYANTKDNQFQIHGHRNSSLLPCKVNSRCFNLECGVEYGGFLRIVSLDGATNNFEVVEIKNTVSRFAIPNVVTSDQFNLDHVFLAQLRKSQWVKEKKLSNDIVSYNFTEKAFFRRAWNTQTIKARGLFVNKATCKVVARSYDKFFNVDEIEATEYHNLPSKLRFPVTCFVKENGFLGIVAGLKNEPSLDPNANNNTSDQPKAEYSLLVCSKSSNDGPYATQFRKFLEGHLKKLGLTSEDLAKDLYNRNCSLVFEVVIPNFDPHIIQYNEATVILLDVIQNHLTKFVRYNQQEREDLAKGYQFAAKRLFAVHNNWEEFDAWYNKVTDPDFTVGAEHVEGFVVEDSANFMFKIKLSYYRKWKQARSIKERLQNGKKVGTKEIKDPEIKQFADWLMSLDKSELKADIITLRNMFLELKPEQNSESSDSNNNNQD